MVLLVLALIWAAALLPPFVRSRLDRSPADSVGRFRRHLRILQSTSPAASALASAPESTPAAMPAIWASEAHRLRGMRRRRQIATGLLITMGATLALGMLPPLRPLLFVHVAADVAFVAYVALLARMRAIESERQLVAHFARLRAEAEADAAEYAQQHPVADVL